MNMAIAKNQLSEELRAFIKDKIQTVLRLEVLLLLHDQQSRSFTAAEIASELGCETEATQEQLTELETIGLAIQSTDKPRYKYLPVNATFGFMVEQLAAAYAKQRVPILSLILADNSDRTRLFVEAFRIISRND